MSFERPSKGALVFQCDACYDTFEFHKSDGRNVNDFRECWSVLHDDEGWTMKSERGTTEHLCRDCSETYRADRANPFRR